MDRLSFDGVSVSSSHRAPFHMTYAGFWHRFGAGVVDALLFTPLCVLSFWAMGEGATLAVVVSAAVSVAYYAYSIVGHALWGQTIGKRVAGVRVRSVGGAPLTWAIAFRRSSVDVAIGILSLIGYAIVLHAIPEADFATKGWQQISEQYDRARPAWVRIVEYGYWVWIAGEVFTVLLNSQRRAIHDFIGGTVVVLEGRAMLQPLATTDAPGRWDKAWAFIDHAGALLGLALAALFILGAAYSASIDDRGAFAGTLTIASYSCAVAALFALARRSASKGHAYHSWVRGAAAALIVLPASLVILALILSTG